MKVITSTGRPVDFETELDCRNCSSRLGVEFTDLFPGMYSASVDSYGDSVEMGVYVVCPVCELQNRVRPVPDHVVKAAHFGSRPDPVEISTAALERHGGGTDPVERARIVVEALREAGRLA